LRRKYRRQHYEVTVLTDGYAMAGQWYPTLYSTVVAITGVKQFVRNDLVGGEGTRDLCSWSATRFWRLEKPEPTLGAEAGGNEIGSDG